MIVEVPTKVTSHECPHCHHEYWSSREACHFYCDTPYRRCNFCGGEFVDKKLYCEWSNMTRRQKRYWLHWHGRPWRIMMAIFGLVLSILVISLTIGSFVSLGKGEDNSIWMLSLALLPGPVVLFVFAFKNFHFIWNYKKDEAVRESLARTGDFSAFDFTSKEPKHKEEKGDSLEDCLKRIEKQHSILFSKIEKLKRKKLSEQDVLFIQNLIVKYDDSFIDRIIYKASNANKDKTIFSELKQVLEELESENVKLKKI